MLQKSKRALILIMQLNLTNGEAVGLSDGFFYAQNHHFLVCVITKCMI